MNGGVEVEVHIQVVLELPHLLYFSQVARLKTRVEENGRLFYVAVGEDYRRLLYPYLALLLSFQSQLAIQCLSDSSFLDFVLFRVHRGVLVLKKDMGVPDIRHFRTYLGGEGCFIK
jgi:hypothetical protein